MIKLVSQFDNEKSRISLATPTCCGGCCCCCCCCIVSSITTASISARNFGKMVQKEYPEDNKKIKSAKEWGFAYPITVLLLVIIWGAISLYTGFLGLIDNFGAILITVLGMPLLIASDLWTKVFKNKYEISNEKLFKKFLGMGFGFYGIAVIEGIICFVIYFVR